MQFAIVGLGRMGLSLGRLAVKQGHRVVGWDPDDSAREAAGDVGLTTVAQLEDVPGALDGPRIVLMWVPHGKVVDDNLDVLVPLLDRRDVLADCGNSFWEDSRRRHDRPPTWACTSWTSAPAAASPTRRAGPARRSWSVDRRRASTSSRRC